eukprot:TRINITY_DN6927_c0_g2_i3.p1 TRINITY_DN6927_c0_g2~~TRINITY_DN6927_c0_g2_i3.p1  ORF type:complete len:330 (-),score=51.44 TRINITY_DN6927_c0_g2_i3:9-962(-)
MEQRFIVQLLSEIAPSLGISLTKLSDDWVLVLKKGNVNRYIYGYTFPFNDSAASNICNDKVAAYLILQHHGIPCVEHVLFLSPELRINIDKDGLWESISNYAEKHNWDLVVKPNKGTGGADVYHTTTKKSLQQAVHRLLKSYRDVSISPFENIDMEYRVVIFYGRPYIMFGKQRLSVVGDGKRNVQSLMLEKLGSISASDLSLFLASDNSINPSILERVLSPGEEHPVQFKHNLGGGAKPIPVTDDTVRKRITDLAIQACRVLDLKFVSVDIIVNKKGEMKIIEINAGVMTEFISRDPKHKEVLRNLYTEVLNKMFE